MNVKVEPVSVSQSSTYQTLYPRLAIDADLATYSHTQCAWNTELWYKMEFDDVLCFSEVVIIQSHWGPRLNNNNAYRMDDTRVFVVNTIKAIESLCGRISISGDMTIDGQTYKISCDLKCGDEVKLKLLHDSGKHKACIHMREITAFAIGQSVNTF